MKAEMTETLNLRHEVRKRNGTAVVVMEGESNGRPFVRIDNQFGPAKYCVRLTHREAGELGESLVKLGRLAPGPHAGAI